MYKFLLSSLVLSLQVSVMQACSRSLVKRSYNVPVSQVLISTNTSLASIQGPANMSSTAYNLTRFNSNFEPQSEAAYNQQNRQLEGSQNRTSLPTGHENDETDLAALRVEYNKYKILSSLGIRTNPDDLAPSGHERLARLEAGKHLISAMKRTELINLTTSVSISSAASIA